jgi:5'-deoxynucleotidase YfbR-like HD superfamily hydrolase
LYAALIGQWLQNHPQTISNIGEPTLLTHRLNWELLMIRATIHDLEESWTGDMPRHFKYSTPELLKVLDDAALAAFRRVIEPLVTPRWVERLVENWLLAKDSRLEGKVIAFADFLSVLSFVVQEYESGNRNAFEHAQRLEEYMSLFKDTGYDAMRPLVEQSEVVVQEVFHAIA